MWFGCGTCWIQISLHTNWEITSLQERKASDGSCSFPGFAKLPWVIVSEYETWLKTEEVEWISFNETEAQVATFKQHFTNSPYVLHHFCNWQEINIRIITKTHKQSFHTPLCIAYISANVTLIPNHHLDQFQCNT